MYQTCPKCGHERAPGDDAPAEACPACGLVYAKWLKQQFTAEPVSARAAASEDTGPGVLASAGALLLHVDARVNPIEFWVRVVVFAALVLYGWHFIAMDVAALGHSPSFMHRVNLPFHEAGHVFFRPFGRTMMYLGGSLAQVLVPLGVLAVFLLKYHNPFAASVGLWWAAQSMMDVAPYIADAREMELMLIGGVTGWEAMGRHDWQQILIEFGCLECDDALAGWVNGLAVVLMLGAFAWGAAVLWRQWRQLARGRAPE